MLVAVCSLILLSNTHILRDVLKIGECYGGRNTVCFDANIEMTQNCLKSRHCQEFFIKSSPPPQDNFSWVPNCSLGPPGWETKVSSNKFWFGLCEIAWFLCQPIANLRRGVCL